MFPEKFEYHQATSIEDAVNLLRSSAGSETALLAGGQGLLPEMKARETTPEVVIDIGNIESLRGVETADPTVIGALTTHSMLAESPPVCERASVLGAAAEEVADTQIRNRGTIGGNLVEADPTADLPAAVVAANATLALTGPDGERTVRAEKFFVGDGETTISDRELLTEIRVPSAPAAGGAYAKKTHPASGYALVGVAASVAVHDWTVTAARVAASGVTNTPMRLRGVEDALVGGPADRETIAMATERAGERLDPDAVRADATASAEFRSHLLSSYAERALTTAVDSTTGRDAAETAGDS